MASTKDILVVGEKNSVLGFTLIGLNTLFWDKEEDPMKKFASLLAEGVNIVFVSENIFQQISPLMKSYENKIYPVFIPIPDLGGSQKIGYDNLVSIVTKAIGTSLINNT